MRSAGIILKNSEGKFLLQHRDDKEGLPARNMWCFFGGMVEENEDPVNTIVREIEEELCFNIKGKTRFVGKFFDTFNVYVYEYLGSVEIGELVQLEGQGMKFFSKEEAMEENVVLTVRQVIKSGKVL